MYVGIRKKAEKGKSDTLTFFSLFPFSFSLCAYSYIRPLYPHLFSCLATYFGLTMPDMTPSSTSGSAPSRHSQRTVPTFVLLSLAVLHSQVYWLYSVIYHLCSNISDQSQNNSPDKAALSVLSRRSGRARAFSEPQHSASSISIARPQAIDSKSSPRNRPRSKSLVWRMNG